MAAEDYERAEQSHRVGVRTATLLLADIVGSARAWEHDAESMTAALGRLEALVDEVIETNSGVRPAELGEGDSFVGVFPLASQAARAALAIRKRLDEAPADDPVGRLRLRVALHTGEVRVRAGDRVMGEAVNRCARIRELAHPRQILVSAPTRDLMLDALPQVRLLDLGVHELRDLSRAERLYQLDLASAPQAFPPPRGSHQRRRNLPAAASSFVGRVQELADGVDLIASHRLVSFVGPGGCGKTRLAVELAGRVVDRFIDDVWFVDLAAVSFSEDVGSTWARTLGAEAGGDANEAIVDRLRDAEALLVIDNCEHVVDDVIPVVQDVVRRCPKVTIVATSREPLGLEGEQVVRVRSLSMPSPDASVEDVASSDAVRLFVDRASQVRPGFELSEATSDAVAGICRRLDGMPLAIELAAARVRVLPPAQINAGLDDCFRVLSGGRRGVHDRHMTLQASIDWSVRLLSASERSVLRRVAVFSGGFSLEAAEFVSGGGNVETYAVLDVLTSLVDKSLVLADENPQDARFHLLEPIRQFAFAELADTGEAVLARNRHLAFFLARSRQLAVPLQLADERAFASVRADFGNFTAAVAWAVSTDDWSKARWLVGNLAFYWTWRGLWSDGLMWVRRVVAGDGEDAPEARAALTVGAFLASRLGDDDLAQRYIRAALRLAEAKQDYATVGWGLQVLANIEQSSGRDLQSVVGVVERALTLGEERIGTAAYLFGLSMRADYQFELGQLDTAAATARAGLTLATERRQHAAVLHERLVVIETDLGNFDAAERAYDAATELRRDIGGLAPWVSFAYGRILAATGRWTEARDAVAAAVRTAGDRVDQTLPRDWGHHEVAMMFRGAADLDGVCAAVEDPPAFPRSRSWSSLYDAAEATVLLVRGDIGAARELFERACGEAQQEGRRVYVSVARLGLAATSRANGDLGESERHCESALREFVDIGARSAAVHALEESAATALAAGDHRLGMRLFAVATFERERLGYVRGPAVAAAYDDLLATARAHLGAAAFDETWQGGSALTVADAAARLRGNRGPRRRPATGWESLTPAELEVVRLVAEGLSNKAVANRLLLSTRTVTTHLSHVFAKLGVSSRSELAVLVERRRRRGGDHAS